MTDQKYTGEFEEGPAAQSIISLSQLIAGPLEALLKAQLHAARSFLNMVLQLGYPHVEVDENGLAQKDASAGQQQLYMQEFAVETKSATGEVKTATLRIPALALVPLAPLSIDAADFAIDFKVSHIFRHQQMQAAATDKTAGEKNFDSFHRPWFLINDPISIRGVLAAKVSDEKKEDNTEESSIKINIKISRQMMPAGIDKLLTSLTQTNSIQ